MNPLQKLGQWINPGYLILIALLGISIWLLTKYNYINIDFMIPKEPFQDYPQTKSYKLYGPVVKDSYDHQVADLPRLAF